MKKRLNNPALAIFNPPYSLYLGQTEKGEWEFKKTTKPIHQSWVRAIGPFKTWNEAADYVEEKLGFDPGGVKGLMAYAYRGRKKNPALAIFNPPKKKSTDLKDYREYIQSLPYKEQMKKIEEAPAWAKEYLKGIVRESMRKGNPKRTSISDPPYPLYLGQDANGNLEFAKTKHPLYKQWIRSWGPFKTWNEIADFVEEHGKDPASVKGLMTYAYRGRKKNPLKRFGSHAKFTHERLRSPKGLHHLRTVTVGGHRIVVGCPVPTHKGRCPVGTVATSLLHPKAEKNPPSGGKMFSENVEKLYYQHKDDNKFYKHKFKKGVCMKAMEDGSIVIFHPSKRLWGDF